MADEDSYIGREIGNYRIIAEIASGAFGTVYKAQHRFLTKRIVAIKLMHRVHLNSQKARDSFIREAELLEALKDPHILPILDFGIDEKLPYLVTEYAPNGSLKDLMERQTPDLLPLEKTVAILSQVGQALLYAQQQNIAHRDLKPENILFNMKGEVLLADFGVATVLSTLKSIHL